MKTPVFLDRTHIRFFHKASAFSLVHSSVMEILAVLGNGAEGPGGGAPRSRLLNWLTLGLLGDGLAKHCLLSAKSLLA
jgi:hypothetical protein